MASIRPTVWPADTGQHVQPCGCHAPAGSLLGLPSSLGAHSAPGMKNSVLLPGLPKPRFPRAPSSFTRTLSSGPLPWAANQLTGVVVLSHGAEGQSVHGRQGHRDRQRGLALGLHSWFLESDDQGLNPGYVTPSPVPWAAKHRSLSPCWDRTLPMGLLEAVSETSCRWQVLTPGPPLCQLWMCWHHILGEWCQVMGHPVWHVVTVLFFGWFFTKRKMGDQTGAPSRPPACLALFPSHKRPATGPWPSLGQRDPMERPPFHPRPRPPTAPQ